MSRNIITGIDIGTYNIKVVIAEYEKRGSKLPSIIGFGFSESRGLRYGYIINTNDVKSSLKKAIDQAERSSKVKIKKAYISTGGISLDSLISSGSTIISRGDNEITDMDIDRAIESSEKNIPQQEITNKKIIHTIPLSYKIDGKTILGRPVGMSGIKFEVNTLFVTCLDQHFQDLVQAVEEIGVEVEDVVAAPIAASLVAISRAQKIAGVVLANIGSETVSIIVYDNNIPISIKVFPIGSTNITNDIALGLKIPLEEAEKIKLGALTRTNFLKKKLDEIIMARLTDMFEMIDSHLKKIHKNGLLPAGIIITGGGSGISTIEDLAKATLKLPSKIAQVKYPMDSKIQIKDSSWTVAYGLCVLGFTDEEESVGIRIAKNTKNNLISWIKQILP
ncbi:cell division protein FtsA [Patescibacteria group bacterium]|nr:cell division protein FtsA [Patescibacteria group bacterium]MBU4057730.1 cell division protein FtsA [Patescibacteria group bacterium]MBU4116089.1 cell division protein FtsA [Patescibacteria group bacterium]